jgi:hypothetical protein
MTCGTKQGHASGAVSIGNRGLPRKININLPLDSIITLQPVKSHRLTPHSEN